MVCNSKADKYEPLVSSVSNIIAPVLSCHRITQITEIHPDHCAALLRTQCSLSGGYRVRVCTIVKAMLIGTIVVCRFTVGWLLLLAIYS